MIGKRASRFTAAVGLSVLLLAMTCCTTVAQPLETTEWKLVEWTLSSIKADDFAIRANFSGGTVSGFSGVNSYSARFSADAAGKFAAGPFSRSKKGHTGAPMRAEEAYLTLLGQAQTYKASGSRLTLYDAGGNESLVFEALAR